jgi:flagellar biosynthetic protein FliQ
MSPDTAVELVRHATLTALLLGAPVLVVALVVGLVINVLQAMTQLQEQTLSLVPRILAMVLTGLLILPWAMARLVEYSIELFRSIPGHY